MDPRLSIEQTFTNENYSKTQSTPAATPNTVNEAAVDGNIERSRNHIGIVASPDRTPVALASPDGIENRKTTTEKPNPKSGKLGSEQFTPFSIEE